MTHDELEQSHREQHFEGLSDDLHANRCDGREKPQLRLLRPQIRRHPLHARTHIDCRFSIRCGIFYAQQGLAGNRTAYYLGVVVLT